MSEYQYYEFQTVNRSLTEQERVSIGKLSSRVKLTATSAIFTYSYGDFRGDPQDFLAKYFDAMYYIANWGTKQLMFCFPKSLVDINQIQPYCVEGFISLNTTSKHVILDICLDDEDGFGWIEEEGGELTQVIDLRNDILKQDYRLLYLAWLKAITLQYIDDNKHEPPVPSGLQELSRSLDAFVELFEVDPYLVQAAAKSSGHQQSIADDSWASEIAKLSRAECDLILLQLVKGQPNLSIQLQRKLSSQIESVQSQSSPPRKISQLLQAAKQQEQETKRKQKQAAKAKRIEELKQFATQETQAWQDIERLLVKPQAKTYEEAVKLLVKLRDLAVYQDKQLQFQERLNNIHERYSRRAGLLRRLKEARLNQI